MAFPLLLTTPQKRRNVDFLSTQAGLRFRYDFSDITTLWQDSARTIPVTANNDPIGACDDKSGLGRHIIQATAGSRPTYKTNIQNGLSVGSFDGSADNLALTGGTSFGQPLWIFAVAKSDDSGGTANHPLIGDSNNRGILLFDNGASNSIRIPFGANLTSATLLDTNWHLHSIKARGTSSLIRLDGLPDTSGNAGTNNFTTEIHVGSNAGVTLFWDGYIGEILFYRADLSDATRDAIEAYLIDKWGIGDTPAGALVDGDSVVLVDDDGKILLEA